MLAIKSNLMADVAARHLGRSYESLSRSVERLSSGLRINSAKDDAAGLAVRELIRADVATLRQGARNAADAISMLQTAEGAMGQVDDILVRMKELAEQASTGSYSADQRALMNQEFTELAKEINRIAETTDFNGIKLLNSTNNYEIHVGSTDGSAANKIAIQAQMMDAGSLGLAGTKEYAVFNTGKGSADDDLVTVTANGTLDFKFDGDMKADGTTDMGNIQITMATDHGGDAKYSATELMQDINTASQAAQSGYDMASIHYDAVSGLYHLKLSAYTTGDVTDLTATAGGGLTTTEGLETIGNYTDTQGSGATSSIANTTDAQTALDAVDAAIVVKDSYRAELGYMMNRLDAAVTVITIQAENLRAAESRISDVDVATEMAEMTRNQVLAQAGVAMLSQANMMPQMALQLLG